MDIEKINFVHIDFDLTENDEYYISDIIFFDKDSNKLDISYSNIVEKNEFNMEDYLSENLVFYLCDMFSDNNLLTIKYT